MSLLSLQREGSGSPLVWLHGFTQTRDSARPFRSILAGAHELWTLDLPGHGEAHAVTATLDETADLVAELLGDDPVALGGYSFGGRVALHVALRHPGRLRALVLLGATRGIEDEEDRAERRRRDEALAAHIEEVGCGVFLDEWLAQPLFATLPDDPVERTSRSRDPHGLAESLRHAGTGTQAWLEPRLSGVVVPTLTIAGSLDTRYLHEARAIADRVVDGRWHSIENAGHAAHLEQPGPCARAVLDFLD